MKSLIAQQPFDQRFQRPRHERGFCWVAWANRWRTADALGWM